MRNVLLPSLLALTGLSGCGLFGPGSPKGIWLLTFTVDENTVATCDTTIQENFTDGYVPGSGGGTDSEWTYTSTFDPSDSLAFAQVDTTTKGGAVMVVGGLAYPGRAEEDVWVFDWVDESTSTEQEDHETGYRFTTTTVTANSGTIRLTIDGGGLAHGTYTSDGSTRVEWNESDEYDQDVADQIGDVGQIPSGDYLVYDDGNGEPPQRNDFEESDCEGETCELAVTEACTLDVVFDAERTDFKEEAAYAHLQGAGQGSI